MKSKIVIPSFTAILMLLFIIACQQPEKKVETVSVVVKELPVTTQSKEALTHFNEGMLAMDLGDGERSRPHFDKAIELDPELGTAYVYRSFSSRSPQEFAADVKMANEKNKNLSEAEQLMVELDNAFLAGDQDKRMETAKAMVEKYPEMARAHVILGQSYDARNDHENARKCYEKAISLSPDWIVGYSSLGGSYIFDEPKDLSKAESNFKKVVELMPNESRTHIGLGDVYRAQKNLDQALASYKDAAKLATNDPVAYTKAGHANTFLGNFEEARSDFEKSGEFSSFPASELNFTAFTYLYEGDMAKGMHWLKEQAMNLDQSDLPKDRVIASQNNMIGSCMWMAYQLGDVKELKSLMDIIGPLDNENTRSTGSKEAMMNYNARMNFRKGLISVLEGKMDAAKEFAEAQKNDLAAIKNPTKLEDYHFLKGEIAMKEKNYTEAVSNYEMSDMDDMFYKYKLAMANKKAGNEEKAMALLNEISDYNFNDIGYALIRKKVKDMLASTS